MVHTCGKGKLNIKVNPYTKTSGVDVGGFSYCKKDVGAVGRGKKLFTIQKKGALTKHGYGVHKSASERHKALRSAVNEFGGTTVFRMLQAQALFRKRTDGLAKTFVADRNYVKSLMPKYERAEMTEPARQARLAM